MSDFEDTMYSLLKRLLTEWNQIERDEEGIGRINLTKSEFMQFHNAIRSNDRFAWCQDRIPEHHYYLPVFRVALVLPKEEVSHRRTP